MSRYTRWVPILFVVSLVFLLMHVLDDALFLNEPADWGVSVPEFLAIVASFYLIIPPLGAALAGRGESLGFVIVLLYALQAFYGAGLNHLRHLTGEFGGAGFVPRALAMLGVTWGDIRGHGFLTGLAAMLGLGVTNPHTHTWWSTAIAVIDVLLNVPLVALCVLALIQVRSSARFRQPDELTAPSKIESPKHSEN
ncbi:MAG: hypothetical protein HY259_06110 [Chloroflexi bacterium]|nr:hypothetical protein [Chloroflexota bacterium]